LSDDTRQKIKEALASGASNREAAASVGVSVGTVSNVRSSSHLETSAKLAQADERARVAQGQYREALSRIGQLEQELSVIRDMGGIVDQVCPMSIALKTSHKRHSAVPFLVASDWHADEVVDKAAMNGLNEYSPTIAKDRAKTLFEAAADILRIYAGNSDIETMVIAALGDFASMFLHDELMQTNALTPPEALLEVLDIWTGGIDYLLASGTIQNILVVGAVGNHGRITKKPMAKRRAQTNYEWILYSLIARHYAGRKENRVQVQMPRGYFNYLEVLGRLIRCHHGDAIRYQGGVGGVHIPLNKAIAQWDKARRADLDIMGHWHQCDFSRKYVINGSLIGYNEYGEQIKAEPEPPQQAMFLLHNRYGHTGFYPLKVQ
jgi:hypothetical protein